MKIVSASNLSHLEMEFLKKGINTECKNFGITGALKYLVELFVKVDHKTPWEAVRKLKEYGVESVSVEDRQETKRLIEAEVNFSENDPDWHGREKAGQKAQKMKSKLYGIGNNEEEKIGE